MPLHCILSLLLSYRVQDVTVPCMPCKFPAIGYMNTLFPTYLILLKLLSTFRVCNILMDWSWNILYSMRMFASRLYKQEIPT
ncbi:hypothetical protein L2E82_16564 [Cichorium intybus]|uniref:Uncharacterized protein n=1 Tax=Cichorium intybus TaxID=13427 RepID=A0ACB9F6H3_CICIN|nr:hypothetical protein L2E82_16564 [Cichorium intybus]